MATAPSSVSSAGLTLTIRSGGEPCGQDSTDGLPHSQSQLIKVPAPGCPIHAVGRNAKRRPCCELDVEVVRVQPTRNSGRCSDYQQQKHNCKSTVCEIRGNPPNSTL